MSCVRMTGIAIVAALALLSGTRGRAEAGNHVLPATPATTQWGWLDPREPPKLRVDSGDTVAVETMMHSLDKIRPGVTMDDLVVLRKANPGGGPHSVTGPIWVNGAEPGDVLEIRILRIDPKPDAFNFHLPGRQFPTIGALAPEFPDGFARFFRLDLERRRVEFKPGIVLDLQPFPGTLAVGIDPNDPSPRKGASRDPLAPVSTLRPWKNGANMDINELREGSRIFVPVFLPGGLAWVGDAHCRQGNGEVNLTALECAYRQIVLQPIVRKDLKLEWPRIETPTHWIMIGVDESLDRAMTNAVRETIAFLTTQAPVPLTRDEAYSLASMVADCRVSQVVDIRKGIHCMIPKSIFVNREPSRPGGDAMHLGITMFATDYAIRPDELAREVEARGFESLWLPEHTHIPASRRSPWPGGPNLPKEYWHTYDPFVALTAAATATTRLRLATGICLVIERDPITTAKEVASLDRLSNGRFIFGIGGGWNAEEMEHHGTPFKRRWRVLRERVLAMKELWTKEEAEFHGEFVNFEKSWAHPKPVQHPHPPILMGGDGPTTFDRVLEFCDGWMPIGVRVQNLSEKILELRRRAAQAGRAPQSVSVTVFAAKPDRAALDGLERAGVERAIFMVPAGPRDEVLPLLDSHATLARRG